MTAYPPAVKPLPSVVINGVLEAGLKRAQARRVIDTLGWQESLSRSFPGYVSAGFAPHHAEFWEWVWAIKHNDRPRPFVAIWPRGGAKSTSAELAAVAVYRRRARNYIVYVCESQEQADKHVSTIASLLESVGVDRAVNKYGSSRGWRRNRLRTADGFTVDALGMDTAARGIKVDEKRPDMIILDDIDGRHDTAQTTEKKKEVLTQTVLPAGSGDCAVLAVQNVIHPKSIFNQLATGTAGFLLDAIVSGPFPALDGFAYDVADNRFVVTGGTPTWAGQGVAWCENFINTSGLIAFQRECQHRMDDAEGALWKREWIDETRLTTPPPSLHKVIAIDPSASSKDGSDEAGIIAAGSDGQQHGYILGDYSLVASPYEWAMAAICAYLIHGASEIVGEGNNGGEMIETVLRSVERADVLEKLIALGYTDAWASAVAVDGKRVPYSMVWASDGKQTRAAPVSALYQRGLIHHVGYYSELETELCNWIPGKGKSPNRLDAMVWVIFQLGLTDAINLPGATDKANPRTASAFVRSEQGDYTHHADELAGWRFGLDRHTEYRSI